MSANDYHFIDNWRVEGNVKEVADILEDALSLSIWGPSVYFEVKELEKGGEVGFEIRVMALQRIERVGASGPGHQMTACRVD